MWHEIKFSQILTPPYYQPLPCLYMYIWFLSHCYSMFPWHKIKTDKNAVASISGLYTSCMFKKESAVLELQEKKGSLFANSNLLFSVVLQK